MDEKQKLLSKRNRIIKIRITEEEHQQLKQRSTRARLAQWMREICLGEKPTAKSKIPKVDPELLRQLSAIGNNVNQIARVINSSEVSVIDRVTIITTLASIDRSLADLKK